MSNIKQEVDVLVDFDLTKIKSRLRKKIVKQLLKNKINIIINIDAYGFDEDQIRFFSDAAVITKKQKKTKKS